MPVIKGFGFVADDQWKHDGAKNAADYFAALAAKYENRPPDRDPFVTFYTPPNFYIFKDGRARHIERVWAVHHRGRPSFWIVRGHEIDSCWLYLETKREPVNYLDAERYRITQPEYAEHLKNGRV